MVNILKNETYIGNMVCMKGGTLSYKNKTAVKKPESEWIRAENTHEPIVSKDTWFAVQKLNSANRKTFAREKRELSLFSGLLVCGECGHIMNSSSSAKTYGGKRTTYNAYGCGRYRKTGYALCSKNSFSERKLLKIIREDLRRHLNKIDGNGQGFISTVQENITEGISGEIKTNMKKLAERLGELDDSNIKLYEKRLDGAISLDTFKQLSADAETERTELQAEYDRLKSAVETVERQALGYDRWLENMRSYLALDEVNREILCSLIEKIEIGKRENGRSQRDIKIFYRFVGLMD